MPEELTSGTGFYKIFSWGKPTPGPGLSRAGMQAPGCMGWKPRRDNKTKKRCRQDEQHKRRKQDGSRTEAERRISLARPYTDPTPTLYRAWSEHRPNTEKAGNMAKIHKNSMSKRRFLPTLVTRTSAVQTEASRRIAPEEYPKSFCARAYRVWPELSKSRGRSLYRKANLRVLLDGENRNGFHIAQTKIFLYA